MGGRSGPLHRGRRARSARRKAAPRAGSASRDSARSPRRTAAQRSSPTSSSRRPRRSRSSTPPRSSTTTSSTTPTRAAAARRRTARSRPRTAPRAGSAMPPPSANPAAILLGDLLVAWSDDLLEQGLAAASPRHRRGGSSRVLAHAPRRDGRAIPRHRRGVRLPHRARRPARRARAARGILQIRPLQRAAAARDRRRPRGSGCRAAGRTRRLRASARHGVPAARRRAGRLRRRRADRQALGRRSSRGQAHRPHRVHARAAGCARPGAWSTNWWAIPSWTTCRSPRSSATIIDTGALDRVETLIAAYAREAERSLSGARLDNAAVSELRDLARAATVRTN